MSDLFRKLDDALLKVIGIVRERVAQGDIDQEELIHFLDLVEDRISSLLEPTHAQKSLDNLTLLEKRKLFRGLGSRAEDTLSALNQYLESYFEEEMNRPGKPN